MRGKREWLACCGLVAFGIATWRLSKMNSHAEPLILTPPPIAQFDFKSDGKPWGEVTRPTTGEPESIGQYAAGCLRGALAAEADGPGFHMVRLTHNRFYGQPELLQFLNDLGTQAQSQKLGDLLIGDMSQPRGGPMRTGHKSHQIGLDADVWVRFAPLGTKALTPEQREHWYTYSLLRADGRGIDARRFSTQHEALFRTAAMHPLVARIFVNPHIKRYLCQRHPTEADAAWLHRLRPWWGHDAHFHVRLHCPLHQAKCIPQDDIPPGSGCGAELDTWFLPDGRVKAPPAAATPTAMVALPTECENVLKE